MTKNEGITVNNPAASTASPNDKKNETLTVSVGENGEMFVGKEKINPAQLPLRLQNFKSANKEGAVVVNGDGDVPYKHIVTVLDEARKVGFTKIAHSVERK